MKINEIKSGDRDVNIEATCLHVSVPRSVNTKYGQTQVASATLEDETGTILLTLWGKQISQVKKNSKVKISGGYVSEYQDQIQINVGKNGKLEVEENDTSE